MNKFYLTTPIYYPNARPHVGSAYTTIVCDVVARYKRMCGCDVAFLTGTDEHGEKLQRAAEAAGIPVEKFVAEKRQLFKDLWRALGIPPYSPETPCGYRFVHTSKNPDHVKSVHWMIRQALKYKIPHCAHCEAYLEHGSAPAACPRCGGAVEFLPAIYKKNYEGRYCVHDERYVSDGTEPADCDICGRPAELIREENYFFKLSAFQERLLELYDKHRDFVQPDFRRNEVVSFVKSGLRDISISRRRLKWGIPWPDDPEEVVYVWYDALTSYLTGIGFRGMEGSRESEVASRDFEKYWMDPEAERVHMIGKDILRFHAVYWPAFLMAAGLPLPKTVFAHGWIYYEQDKMSKSKGNVVYPEPIVDALESFGAPGNDALRYYLLRDTPFGQDASFSYEGLIQRYNSDLANGLGNLASRTLTMVAKYCNGVIPDWSELDRRTGGAWSRPEVDESRRKYVEEICSAYDSFQLSVAAEKIWVIVAHYGDQFLAENKPWARAQDPEQQWFVDGVLYVALEAVRAAAVLAQPILPEATRRIWTQLGCEAYLGKIEDQRFHNWKWKALKPGTKVGKPEPIFPRLDKAATLEKLQELAEADRVRDQAKSPRHDPGAVATTAKEMITVETPEKPAGGEQAQPTATTQGPRHDAGAVATTSPKAGGEDTAATVQKISIEDFAKVEMRVGEVIAAEPIPKATKLLKLQVDIGTEVRQVCAGIAEYYEPQQLIGMKVVIVTNLQPRKLRGVESNGMIVAASASDEGRPVLVTFKEDVPKGARLR